MVILGSRMREDEAQSSGSFSMKTETSTWHTESTKHSKVSRKRTPSLKQSRISSQAQAQVLTLVADNGAMAVTCFNRIGGLAAIGAL